MDDRTGDDLMILAPEVDMPAARAAFARRRAQARRRRRIGSAALATLVVLAGIGAWAAVPEDEGAVVDSGLATVPDEPAPTRPDPTPTAPEGSTPTMGEDTPATDPEQPSSDCERPAGSSPATFDPAGGIYAAHVRAFDPTASTLTFDVVQWLTGDDAVEAYRHDEPGTTDGPPNDYYVVNQSHTERTVPVAPDVTVGLVRLATTGTVDVKPGTFSELPGYVPAGDPATTVYWLTVADGTVTGICEQYRP